MLLFSQIALLVSFLTLAQAQQQLLSGFSIDPSQVAALMSYYQTKTVTTPVAVESFLSKYGTDLNPDAVSVLKDVPTSALLSFLAEAMPTSIISGPLNPYILYSQVLNGQTPTGLPSPTATGKDEGSSISGDASNSQTMFTIVQTSKDGSSLVTASTTLTNSPSNSASRSSSQGGSSNVASGSSSQGGSSSVAAETTKQGSGTNSNMPIAASALISICCLLPLVAFY